MDSDLTYLAGAEIRNVRPLEPYSDIVCSFLDTFSSALLHDASCKAYSDITAVAFWARKGNIARQKGRQEKDVLRMGRGLAFHVTPSNIPVQFIFSYMFGLLAGNANIVRVTTKDYPQISLLCRVLENVLEQEEFRQIRSMTSIVRYPRESEWTREFSSRCQVRLIWGGDATIGRIREYPISPRAVELVFADRYSLALLHEGMVAEADDEDLRRLARNFYNDTFLMDQNACSSPQLILWQGDGQTVHGRERFWQAVEELAKKQYQLAPVKATAKYAEFCSNAVQFPQTGMLQKHDNFLYRVPLREFPQNMEDLRGKFGLFYEGDVRDLSEIGPAVNGKYQTLTYFGVNPKALARTVIEHQWMGIDRIVPVGKALDMDVIWDGYDLVHEMTRVVDVR